MKPKKRKSAVKELKGIFGDIQDVPKADDLQNDEYNEVVVYDSEEAI